VNYNIGVWYENLSVTEKVFFILGVVSGAILVFQTVMTLIGGHFGGEVDTDGDGLDSDGDTDGDTGFNLFTIRGLVTLISVGSWSILALYPTALPHWASVLLGSVFGAIAFVGIAFLFAWFFKLQQNGTMDVKDSVGKTGTVYLSIGENGKSGKVSLKFSGQLREVEAVSKSGEAIKTGAMVKVVESLGNNIVVVEQLNRNPDATGLE
jgi:hypothetical protein